MRRIAIICALTSCLSLPSCFAQVTTPNVDVQTATPASQDPTALLAALAKAFSSGKPVSNVTLTGSASWTAGGVDDSGTVSMSVANTGATHIQLSLGKQGTRSEDFAGSGTNMTCQWTDPDQQVHVIGSANCWKPFLWFLPAFSLQPTLLPTSVGVLDLGTDTVGSGSALYRHLFGALLLDKTTSQATRNVMAWSGTDLGLDPITSLPAVLSYTLVPEKGSAAPISIEIRYANYTSVDGVVIPFSIQRYVNGSLQLSITIQNAQTN